MLDAGVVIEKLRKFPWKRFGVRYAIVFGSVARGCSVARDVDIAVKFRVYTLDAYAELLVALAKHLRVREDLIDLVPLNRGDLPAHLIVEIYSKGKLVYVEDVEEYLNDVSSRVEIAIDFLIDFRKLKLAETVVRSVKRAWYSSKRS